MANNAMVIFIGLGIARVYLGILDNMRIIAIKAANAAAISAVGLSAPMLKGT